MGVKSPNSQTLGELKTDDILLQFFFLQNNFFQSELTNFTSAFQAGLGFLYYKYCFLYTVNNVFFIL